MMYNNKIIMHKELKQKNEIFNARKKCKKKELLWKENLCLLSNVFGIGERNNNKIATKKMHKQPRKCSIQGILEDEEDEILKNENNSSDFDCIIFRPRK